MKRQINLLPYMLEGIPEAGCDEAGRGPLAGPVFAAAVILPEDFHHPLLNDSKKMTPSDREALAPLIRKEAVAWAVAEVSAQEIDALNILWASIEGMHRALRSLSCTPEHILVDGNRWRDFEGIPFHTVVHGDATYASIAAASVLAKTCRDSRMKELSAQFPQYGWERNMGYPTAEHIAAIKKFGFSPFHRKSFHPKELEPTLF